MFKTNVYISTLIELLKTTYHERLLYVGLQGSYLRGEATEHSDIDIMVVISDIEPHTRFAVTLLWKDC